MSVKAICARAVLLESAQVLYISSKEQKLH